MKSEPLHHLSHAEALARRWERGVMRYRGGNLARPFVGDAAAEALEEALDLEIYAGEMLRQGYSHALIANVKRHAKAAAMALRRALRAMEDGGTVQSEGPCAIHEARERRGE